MNDIAIRVENLSKHYRIGVERHDTLRDALSDFRLGILDFGRKSPKSKIANPKSEEFWALRDVSFEVQRGEVVGVIGRNGAGKSTLLKILSRITEPTTGFVELHGRVGSLLEVGTGFHPELTGRENIYLNGAILGMKRTEIARKFDEIVAFSEIEKFLDTPVKRYSSGMYVRLAFAVAAHLEPEILLVDEVLAVGDAAFQKKCLGKMGDIAGEGRTVLFVSHNMAAVLELCTHAIVLQSGEMALSKSDKFLSIDFYSKTVINGLVNLDIGERLDRSGSGKLRFTEVTFHRSNGEPLSVLTCGQFLRIRLHYSCLKLLHDVSVSISFGAHAGENKILLWTSLLDANYKEVNGSGYFECIVPRLPLFPGTYFVSIYCQSGLEILDWIREVKMVEIQEGNFFGIDRLVKQSGQLAVLVDHDWR